MNRLIDRYAVVFVAVAATLWASDAYFRNQLVQHLSATQIVVAEDGLVTLFLLPVLIRSRGELKKLGRRGWLAVGTIAAGAQALATILFTASFSIAAQHGLFAETFVLQQTQPLIAIALAWIVLGERRRPWFWPAAVVGIAAVYMVLFWSMTSLRFTLAFPVLVVIVLVQSGLGGFSHYRVSDFLPNLLAIAIVPGLLALLLYYRALSKTPASLATIAEMAYPVAATLIASAPYPWGFHQPLYPAQLLGTAVLLGVIVFLNWTRERAPVVVVRPLSVAEV